MLKGSVCDLCAQVTGAQKAKHTKNSSQKIPTGDQSQIQLVSIYEYNFVLSITSCLPVLYSISKIHSSGSFVTLQTLKRHDTTPVGFGIL